MRRNYRLSTPVALVYRYIAKCSCGDKPAVRFCALTAGAVLGCRRAALSAFFLEDLATSATGLKREPYCGKAAKGPLTAPNAPGFARPKGGGR